MSLKGILWTLLALGALVSAAHQFRLRPVTQPDGILAPQDPLQGEPGDTSLIRMGHWQLTPRAQYDITARILSREDYHFDTLAALVPEDLALGWGPMSDNRTLAQFDISQGARFYEWQPHGSLPIPRIEVVTHSANTHVIPASDAIRRELAQLRVGDVVRLTGELVDGTRDDGTYFHTSLTRLDEGAGACEVLLVRSVALTH
ncbi:MAG: hypothetical protein JSS29_13535 [Proteobacteria bacterium]|nr:hypothetical protein [Pseudomonadota bacterium]